MEREKKNGLFMLWNESSVQREIKCVKTIAKMKYRSAKITINEYDYKQTKCTFWISLHNLNKLTLKQKINNVKLRGANYSVIEMFASEAELK